MYVLTMPHTRIRLSEGRLNTCAEQAVGDPYTADSPSADCRLGRLLVALPPYTCLSIGCGWLPRGEDTAAWRNPEGSVGSDRNIRQRKCSMYAGVTTLNSARKTLNRRGKGCWARDAQPFFPLSPEGDSPQKGEICGVHNLSFHRDDVVGKSLEAENHYPIQALLAYIRHAQRKPRQLGLVRTASGSRTAAAATAVAHRQSDSPDD